MAPNIMFAYVTNQADIFSPPSAKKFVKNAAVVSAKSFGVISFARCLPRGLPGGGTAYNRKSNSSSNSCLICGCLTTGGS